MPSDYDSPWKEALDRYFEPFLAFFLPDAHAGIDWMMDLPKELTQQFKQEIHRFEEEKKMPYVSSVERLAIEEGRAQGLSEGLLEGIEQNLKSKFGPEALKLMPEIRQIRDVEKLRTVLQAVETSTSPEELRRIWA